MRSVFRNAILLCLLATKFAWARVEIILGIPNPKKPHCAAEYILISGDRPYQLNATSFINHKKTWDDTIQQVIQTYRELGTAPESYLRKIAGADRRYPPGAVVYIRSVNDVTGEVEGIMRLVSGDPFSRNYFNLEFARKIEGQDPVLPMRDYYKNPRFQKFMDDNYPNAIEAGRLVFGKDVKRSRVLIELFSAVAEISRQKSGQPRPDRYLVVEVVPDAVTLVEAFPFKKVELPIEFDDGRIFMAAKLSDFHDRLVLNPLKLREADLDKAFEIFSDSPRLQSVFLHGFEQRAFESYDKHDLVKMWADVKELTKHSPNNKNYRWLEMYAEAGRRYNWFTGQGNLQEAIDFLDKPESVRRFDDEFLPKDSFSHGRLLLKGYLYLRAGDFGRAKAVREEQEKRIAERAQAAARVGRIAYEATPEIHTAAQVGRWKSELFDPVTGVGDPIRALAAVEASSEELLHVLSPRFHQYHADVLRALGRE